MAEAIQTAADGRRQTTAAVRATPMAVLVEGGRRGLAAVDAAVALAAREPIRIVLVSVVAQAQNSGCTMSAEPLNAAVCEAAETELARARARLAYAAPACRSILLRERTDPGLGVWLAAERIERVLLPGRPRRLRGGLAHPAGRTLAAVSGLTVSVV